MQLEPGSLLALLEADAGRLALVLGQVDVVGREGGGQFRTHDGHELLQLLGVTGYERDGLACHDAAAAAVCLFAFSR